MCRGPFRRCWSQARSVQPSTAGYRIRATRLCSQCETTVRSLSGVGTTSSPFDVSAAAATTDSGTSPLSAPLYLMTGVVGSFLNAVAGTDSPDDAAAVFSFSLPAAAVGAVIDLEFACKARRAWSSGDHLKWLSVPQGVREQTRQAKTLVSRQTTQRRNGSRSQRTFARTGEGPTPCLRCLTSKVAVRPGRRRA